MHVFCCLTKQDTWGVQSITVLSRRAFVWVQHLTRNTWPVALFYGEHSHITFLHIENLTMSLKLSSLLIKMIMNCGGWGNTTVVSISVCQAGCTGSSLARSACFRKVEFKQGAIDLFPPMLTTGSTKAFHVLSCLCDNACKRSLAICHKSRALCPISRLLSVPIWPACAKHGL